MDRKPPQVIFESPAPPKRAAESIGYRKIDRGVWKNDGPRFRFLFVSVVANIVILCGCVINLLLIWRAMENQSQMNPALFARVQTLGTVATVLLLLRCAGEMSVFVAWLLWQYRVQMNLAGMGHRKMRFSPKMGVVWHLVPFASYVWPCLVVTEIARLSSCSGDFSPRRSGWQVGVWWMLYLSVVLMALYFWVNAEVPTRWEELRPQLIQGIAVAGLEMLLMVVTFLLARLIRADQQAQITAIET